MIKGTKLILEFQFYKYRVVIGGIAAHETYPVPVAGRGCCRPVTVGSHGIGLNVEIVRYENVVNAIIAFQVGAKIIVSSIFGKAQAGAGVGVL